ncbi:MAG: hypothetical protein JRI97_10415, partial [Deltaproteobacteria bacterium]|nr:hypothetical protein [Deltaproteobacteria bacterium]
MNASGKSAPGRSRDKGLNADFLFLLLLLFVLSFPLLFNTTIVMHDTRDAFDIFYSFYNTFFYNSEIMQWFPYGMYGVQSLPYQINILSPESYLIILAGKLFHVENTLFMFKLSVLLEQSFYL